MNNNLKIEKWDDSYAKNGNVLFYPDEEVIRFISRKIKKRIGYDKYITFDDSMNTVLDLGCGIGRHVFALEEQGFNVFGIDLSKVAISKAQEICERRNKAELINNFSVGDVTNLPYEDNMFDFIISPEVLDSMHFKIAQKAIEEITRVLRSKGLFYLDLIMDNEFSNKEVIVDIDHENGTIQSYFNEEKIQKLLANDFEIIDFSIHERHDRDMNLLNRRAHIVCKKIK